MLKLILSVIGDFARQAWLLPQALTNAIIQRREQTALEEQETERLDRIRNPSKYLGKS
jgi:hypothetical protein